MSVAWVWHNSWKRTPVSLIDLALIDAVVIDEIFIGSKTFWDLSRVKEVYTTQGHPSYIGVTSIGGSPHPIRAEDDHGLYLHIGEGNTKVKAAITLGVIREVEIYPQDEMEIELSRDGPRVVKIKEALEEAVSQGFFISSGAYI